MGLFDKKYCSICDAKIGLLGNRKLSDGNMCKTCAAKLSPFFSERRQSTIEEIQEQLAYREANEERVKNFHPTRTLGTNHKVILDENNDQFIVTSYNNWQDHNPDVIDFSQVTGCDSEIRENRNEIMREDKDGRSVSYTPPRYETDYDFYVTIHVNSPWFQEIEFKTNVFSVDKRTSSLYRDNERIINEIRDALTEVRTSTRQAYEEAITPKAASTCRHCGATTTPDAQGRCEYCGGAV